MPNWGKKFYSHKFKSSALRYEVALSIQLGEICWIYGPKPPGLYNDLQFFRMGLMLELDANEKVVADGVYRAEAPHRVKAPHTIFSFRNEEEEKRVRSRHEHINRRFKEWGILSQQWRHRFRDHQDVFRAIACLEQICIENGERLSTVEYSD